MRSRPCTLSALVASLVAGLETTSLLQLGSSNRLEFPISREGPFRRALSAASSTIPVTNFDSTQYTIDLDIDGSTYNVQIDTGSADLWISCDAVSSSTCVPCPPTARTIIYGSGSACVVPQTSELSIGHIKIQDAIYGIEMGSNILGSNAQGILGLSFPFISVFYNNSTAPYILGQLDSFSIYLTVKENATGSKLILNGIDDAMIAQDKSTGFTSPLYANDNRYWNILIDEFVIDPAPIPPSSVFLTPCRNGNCLAIVDSGTTFLSMPKFIFNEVRHGLFLAYHPYISPNMCVYVVCKDVSASPTMCLQEQPILCVSTSDFTASLRLETQRECIFFERMGLFLGLFYDRNHCSITSNT
jgi:hypothetical protein